MKIPEKQMLAVDGDLLLYRAASACERETQWSRNVWTLSTNVAEVKAVALRQLKEWKKKLKPKRILVCLSSPRNFRKEINPDYKGNREHVRKPMGWKHLQEWIRSEDFPYETVERDGLEADDCIGILATSFPNVIIVSDDKDFFTIPGMMYRVGIADREPEFHRTSPEEADLNFYTQCIAGDPVDGYSGAPGFGVDSARRLLEEGKKWEQYEHTFKRGKRKGETETRKRKVDAGSPWETVLSCYQVAGMDEEDALLNARMARILHTEDYDRKKEKPILWTP